MIKYSLSTKTENPKFKYLVKDSYDMDYYLFIDFDRALKKLKSLSNQKSYDALLYEKRFNNNTREWFGKPTFWAEDGRIFYDPYAETELHLKFYVDAGDWLNPDELKNYKEDK